MKEERKAIGEVDCPVKGCDLVAQVFKFKAASEDPRFQRRAGKCYLKCKAHGTIGLDGAQGIQEHIVSKGKIWGDKPPAAQPAAVPAEPAPAPRASSAAPKPAPTPAPAPKRKGIFGWSNR